MASASPAAHFRASNLVTYVAIGAGLTAAVAPPGARAVPGAALAVAALADLYDGRFARLFKHTDEQARFGVQIDSLSDVLSFGLAPAVVLARRLEPTAPLERFAFLACAFVYVVCAVTRLAHYNVTESKQPGFVGVPTTLFGIVWSAWLLGTPTLPATCAALVVSGALMVSPFRIPRPGIKTFVVLTLGCIGLAATHAIRGG